MHHVFFHGPLIVGDEVVIDGPDAHHLLRVVRLAVGNTICLLDGQNTAYEATISLATKDTLTALIERSRTVVAAPISLTLYQGLPKGDKWEWIIQKATELGVSRLVPLATGRSVVQWRDDKAPAKLTRWRNIAREAAEQCERGTLPELEPPCAIDRLTLPPGMLALVMAERVAGPSLSAALPADPPPSLGLFIGPEGGWLPAERERLAALGAIAVSLGPRILRTETAALAAVALAMAHYEP